MPPPEWEGAFWAQTAKSAIYFLRERIVTRASLDHDLEDKPRRGHKERTGLTVVRWMVEHNTWPTEGITVHSWNPVGAKAMCDMIDRYGPYDTKTRHVPAEGIPFDVQN